MNKPQALFENVPRPAFNQWARGVINGGHNLVKIRFGMRRPDIEYMVHTAAELRFLQHVEKCLPYGGKAHVGAAALDMGADDFGFVDAQGAAAHAFRVGDLPQLGRDILKGQVKGRVVVDVTG